MTAPNTPHHPAANHHRNNSKAMPVSRRRPSRLIVALSAALIVTGCTHTAATAPTLPVTTPSAAPLTPTTSSAATAPSTTTTVSGIAPASTPALASKTASASTTTSPAGRQQVSSPVTTTTGAQRSRSVESNSVPTTTSSIAPVATTATDRSGRAAYVAAAEAVCGRASTELAAVAPAIGPQDLVATLTAELGVQRRTLTALQQIPESPADRSQIVQRFLQPFQHAIADQQVLLPAIQAAVKSGDHIQLATLHTQYDQASHPPAPASFVRDFGIRSCQSFEDFRGP